MITLQKVFQGTVLDATAYALDAPTTWNDMISDGLMVCAMRFNGVRSTGHVIPMSGYDGIDATGFRLPYSGTQQQALTGVTALGGAAFTYSGAPTCDTLAIYKVDLAAMVVSGAKLFDADVTDAVSYNLSSGTWGDIKNNHGAALFTYRQSHASTSFGHWGSLIVLENYEDGTGFGLAGSYSEIAGLSSVHLADGQFNWTPVTSSTSGKLIIHGIDVSIT